MTLNDNARHRGYGYQIAAIITGAFGTFIVLWGWWTYHWRVANGYNPFYNDGETTPISGYLVLAMFVIALAVILQCCALSGKKQRAVYELEIAERQLELQVSLLRALNQPSVSPAVPGDVAADTVDLNLVGEKSAGDEV